MKEHDYFHVVEGWCVGKACLAHRRIRRVLLGNETSA